MRDAYDDDDFYDDDGGAWPVRAIAVGALVVTAIVVAWFGLLPFGGGEEQMATASIPASSSAADGSTATTTPDRPESSDVASDDEVAQGTADPTSEAEALTTTPPTSQDAVQTTSPPEAATPSTTAAATTTTAATTTQPPASQPDAVNYPTLPDGSPVPVLAIYDGELITLSGAVPSEAAAERLRLLALANSTVPGAEVASFLTIEPTVPIGVGVRVIEANSPRFPEGSPTISLEHAVQLDRVVAVMTALPNVTVEVIGHADQRGDSEANFMLSAERARSAADYVASKGVDPSRLSSRGAGESDLLTLNNDEASLALNRRTEFVFFGLLLDDPEPT